MTKDLEETLAELGPGYREVVEKVRAAYRPCEFTPPAEPRFGRLIGRAAPWLIAASFVLVVGLGVLLKPSTVRPVSANAIVYTVAYAADEAALAAIVANQRADGSWANDFLTRQNAAALRGASDGLARVAYKKAVRYLRARGLEPLTDLELKQRGDYAAQAVARL